MPIFDDPARALEGRYPSRPARLRHALAGDPLFSLEALVDLAARLPAPSVEYNAGELAVDQNPDETPSNGLSAAETIRRIRECKSWMVLKNVEQDAAYAGALARCLAEIEGPARAATGPVQKTIGFIFISSPGAVTPFHMDPEHNILMQVEGSKRIHVYPADKGIVSDEQHELYHVGDAHRNLRYNPTFDALDQAFDLAPGDAVYLPVKAPHWVKNGLEASISFSITWRSRTSLDEARLRLANHWMRERGGRPPAPGKAPLRDRAMIFGHKVAARLALPFR